MWRGSGNHLGKVEERSWLWQLSADGDDASPLFLVHFVWYSLGVACPESGRMMGNRGGRDLKAWCTYARRVTERLSERSYSLSGDSVWS